MHLAHPPLVHFAVAFLLTGAVVEAWGILAARERVERFGGILVLVGTGWLVPTVASGFLAVNSVTLDDASRTVAENHERMGLVVLAVFLGLALWKAWHRGTVPPSQRRLYAGSLLVATAVVVATALLGGALVYEHGVGVAPSGAAQERLEGVTGDLRILA